MSDEDLRFEFIASHLLDISDGTTKPIIHMQPYTRGYGERRWTKRGPGFVSNSVAEHLERAVDLIKEGKLDILLDPKAHAEEGN